MQRDGVIPNIKLVEEVAKGKELVRDLDVRVGRNELEVRGEFGVGTI